MNIFRAWRDPSPGALGAVVAIGNFDGVHRGHQAVLATAREVARAQGAPFGVLTFDPHPRVFLRPGEPAFRVAPFATNARLFRAAGVVSLYALDFDAPFAQLSAEAFVRDVLVAGLAVRHVVCGEDYTFGRDRTGTVELLRDLGQRLGFGLTQVAPVHHDGAAGRISSTRIRSLLQRDGAVDQAADLLGHWWEVEGFVGKGDQRGRQLGFPTANVDMGQSLVPRHGVYAVRAGVAGAQGVVWHDAVANLGLRPTFGKDAVALEAHLIGYQGDLYGRRLRISFHRFIRPEMKFNGLDALTAQIAADKETARQDLMRPDFALDRYGLPA
jgi:riboflavin kinase/FMN adenylyltransferase